MPAIARSMKPELPQHAYHQHGGDDLRLPPSADLTGEQRAHQGAEVDDQAGDDGGEPGRGWPRPDMGEVPSTPSENALASSKLTSLPILSLLVLNRQVHITNQHRQSTVTNDRF